MSVDALKEFGKKCIEDEEMKAKVKEIGMKDLSGIMSYAKEKGFDFNEDDMKALSEQSQASDELSEADLENVAGGIVTSTGAAVVGAAAAVVGSATAVTSTTTGDGW